MPLSWEGVQKIESKSYTCGYCDNPLASEKGWWARTAPGGNDAGHRIYVCHQCSKPSYFDRDGTQTPSVTFGNPVKDIPDETVEQLYDEARRTTGSSAFTAAALCCRKLLMHIAVSKGATPGDTFVNYVQFLVDKNLIPPDARDWVDHIRIKGNEANHEIAIMGQADAEELLSFVEMLLKVIFEFPASVKRHSAKP